MRHCPVCHSPVEQGYEFCDQCGAPLTPAPGTDRGPRESYTPRDLAKTAALSGEIGGFPAVVVKCSACGKENLPGEMFCQFCGVQLPPVASNLPPPPTPLTGVLGRQRKSAQAESILPDQVQETGKSRLVLHGSTIEFLLPVSQKEVLIGRSDPAKDIYPDIDLAPYEGERKGVSRRHARIVRDSKGTYLVDLNSTNFTFLNQKKLQPGQEYFLKDGDKVSLGLLVLEYRSS